MCACPLSTAAVPYSDRQYADPRFPADQMYADSRYPSASNYASAHYPTSDSVPAPTTDARYPLAPPCPPAPESPAQYGGPSAYARDAFPQEHDAAPRPATADVDYPPGPASPGSADPIPSAQPPLPDASKANARAHRDEDEDDRDSEADVKVTGKRAGSDGDGDGEGGKARRHYTEFTKFTYELMVASLVAGPRGGRWGCSAQAHDADRHCPFGPARLASAPARRGPDHDRVGPARPDAPTAHFHPRRSPATRRGHAGSAARTRRHLAQEVGPAQGEFTDRPGPPALPVSGLGGGRGRDLGPAARTGT
ncbi:hypothetical protein AMAG_19953 [Allomyces macrogynus ATCC 38327]|uniref:Uncharacterized protein n=1 Tax=Allomyces macrogynus (strain ATCC 38327) TaxID=578462 RepID=A0A0L0T3D5_ALLM3|nr:hypothetical protein AMAG_19953 [Allomyces macrogynus ATCC 38327]|eukprot:KNE69074.1 hypothetical protein AMAG_19953 [Allomyces macrogynus ATCC 38327]